MSRASAILACAALAAMLAGCREQLRVPSAGSIKDDLVPRAAVAAPERAVAEPSVIDRAKAEQAARCGQRHIDHNKGALRENVDEKRSADATCAELHKYDYVR